MEMSGEYKIPASREEVWAALNDPDKLKEAIPGCESITKVSDTEMEAVATTKIGPVKAKFKGTVNLEDLDPPNGYTIRGEGNGGAAGFAKGLAKVKLSEDGDGTLLSYDVDAQVGGKLAQIGQRLVDSAAKKMSDDFFSAFSGMMGGVSTAPEPEPAKGLEGIDGIPAGVWAAGLIVLTIVLLAIFGTG